MPRRSRVGIIESSVADHRERKDKAPDPGEHSPCGTRHVALPEQVRKRKSPGDGDERAEEIAGGNSKQSARANDGKLNEQQSGCDRTDHEHCGGICGSEFSDVSERPRLGGSVDSRTCCSSETPVVAGAAASAREPVPF